MCMNNTTKYLLVSIVSIIVLSSCEMIDSVQGIQETIEYFEDGYIEQDIPYNPSSFDEAWMWVSSNIEYKLDPESGRKQSPETTYALRTGDCEDYAILLSYFAYKLNMDVSVVTGINSNGVMHAVNRYNGILIEPQRHNKIVRNFTIENEYTYQEAFYTPFIRSINN